MPAFTTKPLAPATWPDFAALVARHNGIWGGCWCIAFHEPPHGSKEANCKAKECRVRDGAAHAALVYDGDRCVGWCQFGAPDELPRIKHRKAYTAGLAKLPDWRITCFFVDKNYRGRGVSEVALTGAIQEIRRLGGGVIESYPEDVAGRKTSGAFLYNATLAMFERAGFKRTRRLGKNHWVVVKRLRAV